MKSAIEKLMHSLRKRGPIGLISHICLDLGHSLGKILANIRDHRGSALISGEPTHREILIVVLAGYKPALWPLSLRRIAQYAPSDASVCVATAGKRVDEIEKFCLRQQWTYLSTQKNKTGLALNKSIKAHPSAKWIFKLDEDIFIPKNFFEDMRNGYNDITLSGQHLPGFCAPTLNVNGISYATFLEKLGLKKDYQCLFNEQRIACDGVHVHSNPMAAVWIWERSLPLEDIAKRFRACDSIDSPAKFQIIGSRFSIGAILLERSFLDDMGGFRSSWRQGILGVDELALCTACVEKSRPMFYLTNIMAGHFSFYPQEKAMLEALPRLAQADPETFHRA